jgi:hypothetical protein
MEQYERVSNYKEYELHVTCIHERHGWAVDTLSVVKGATTLLPHQADPFHVYRTGRAAELAGMDEARHYVDHIMLGHAGNA